MSFLLCFSKWRMLKVFKRKPYLWTRVEQFPKTGFCGPHCTWPQGIAKVHTSDRSGIACGFPVTLYIDYLAVEVR